MRRMLICLALLFCGISLSGQEKTIPFGFPPCPDAHGCPFSVHLGVIRTAVWDDDLKMWLKPPCNVPHEGECHGLAAVSLDIEPGQGVVTLMTTLTVQTHWQDGSKASGSLTVTGNGTTQTVTDASNGVFTISVSLVSGVNYHIVWQSSNPDPAYVALAPTTLDFIPCCGFDSSKLRDAELDVIFARPTDPGGFAQVDQKIFFHRVPK